MKLGAGAALGSGKQYMSWIHLDDLCRLFMAMLEDESWHGTYNAVAPNPVTNQQFTETLAQVLHRRLLLPKVPAFGLKLAMGEMSDIVLASQNVSARKVLAQGFRLSTRNCAGPWRRSTLGNNGRYRKMSGMPRKSSGDYGEYPARFGKCPKVLARQPIVLGMHSMVPKTCQWCY
jgi:hypothetical protein